STRSFPILSPPVLEIDFWLHRSILVISTWRPESSLTSHMALNLSYGVPDVRISRNCARDTVGSSHFDDPISPDWSDQVGHPSRSRHGTPDARSTHGASITSKQ